MRSRRALGITALVAVMVAAISFAVVDISTSAANGCLASATPCTELTTPPLASICAVVGAIALVGAVIPAIAWLYQNLSTHQETRHTAVDYSRRPSARQAGVDEHDLTDG